jgi:hypothetical protein
MQGQESAGPEFPFLIISGQAAKTPMISFEPRLLLFVSFVSCVPLTRFARYSKTVNIPITVLNIIDSQSRH